MKILAQGESGEFWLAANKVNGSMAVVKKPKATFTQKMLGEEIDLLVSCQHPNIIKFITADFHASEQTFSLVFEYAERGCLRKYLQEERGTINSSMLLGLATNVASGMIELAKNRIIHCDLRARNILIDSHLVGKIASFSKAQHLKADKNFMICNSIKLAVRWQPPEVLNDQKFSLKSDVWSFGVLLAELFSYGGTPYPTLKAQEVKGYVSSRKILKKPSECPPEVYDLMKECFQQHVDRRFPFTAIHKALKQLHSRFFRKPTPEDNVSDFEDY